MSEQVPGEERDACAHCRGRGGCARNVTATCDVDGVSETDGCLVLPEVLRPAPGEGISARLIVPRGGIRTLPKPSPLQCWLQSKCQTHAILI